MPKVAQPFDVDSHFDGKDPEVRKIYARIVAALRLFGQVLEDPKKTSIHLVRSSAVAGVQTRKSHLILTIKADRAIESPRIHKSEQASAHRFHHQIKLSQVKQIDAELREWLQNAYALGA